MRAKNGTKPSDKAFALTYSDKGAQKFFAVNESATVQGLRAGMSLAEGRAILPDLIVEAATPDFDAKKREELARWLVRYTPLTACDTSDAESILLDVTGCAHLFGGEEALAMEIHTRLAKGGIVTRLGMAENRAVAWALSHYRPGSISKTETESRQLLASLPVRALRLDAATVLTLQRLGLKTIGCLYALPRASLARRFRGVPAKQVEALLTRLDQLTGRRDEPFSPLVPLPNWSVRHAFSEPALHMPMIESVAEQLLDELVEKLATEEVGLRRLELRAFRVDGGCQVIHVGTNIASRDKRHIFRLLMEKMDTLEAEFGFDLLMLVAVETERLPPTQYDEAGFQAREAVSELLDRLVVRLGPKAVFNLKHTPSHLPERAQKFVPPQTGELGWDVCPTNIAPRPLRLLPRPEKIEVLAEVPEGAPRRFKWRRVEHSIIKADGPERLAPEWWRGRGGQTRDYYRVEAETGARFWVFRHGLYSVTGVRQETSEQTVVKPSWYLHGFFA